jgi:hypothetical protein
MHSAGTSEADIITSVVVAVDIVGASLSPLRHCSTTATSPPQRYFIVVMPSSSLSPLVVVSLSSCHRRRVIVVASSSPRHHLHFITKVSSPLRHYRHITTDRIIIITSFVPTSLCPRFFVTSFFTSTSVCTATSHSPRQY